MKYLKVSCCLFLKFWRNFLLPSSKRRGKKGPKVTSGSWCFPDFPRTSILNISGKCISVVIFLVTVHQMFVLDTKNFVIVYSFNFGKTTYERTKSVPKWHLRDLLETSLGLQFQHFLLNRILGKFFYIS